jgi:hypothetical protein
MNAHDASLAVEIFGELIHTYSRADALDDGYLVDVSKTAREAGFRFPVALTRAAWNDCVEWTEADSDRKHWPQDEAGRLWDVLTMTRFYMRGVVRRDPDTDRFMLQVLRVPREGRGVKARMVRLMAHLGPGDQGEPVITVGFPSDF